MIVTVTLNPAIDIAYTVPQFAVGASHRPETVSERAGGKGVNVARVLIEQGIPATVVAPVGGRSGAQFEADCDAAAIPHRLVPVAATTRRTIAVVDPEHTTNLNEAGTCPSADELDQLLAAVGQALAGASVLVCSGSMPAGAPSDLIGRIVRLGTGADLPVIVDTSGPALLAAADAHASVLKPNRAELLAAFDRDDQSSTTELLTVGRQLQRRSGGWIAVSLGADGLMVLGPDRPARHARLGQSLSGNTTGAGDAVVAAIAAALATGEPLDGDRALRRATSWSAAAVLDAAAGSIADPRPLAAQVSIQTLRPDDEPEHP